jgi:hypothetical protein
VGKMPDFGAIADVDRGVDNGARMGVITHDGENGNACSRTWTTATA